MYKISHNTSMKVNFSIHYEVHNINLKFQSYTRNFFLLKVKGSNFDIKSKFICFNSHKAVFHLAGSTGPIRPVLSSQSENLHQFLNLHQSEILHQSLNLHQSENLHQYFNLHQSEKSTNFLIFTNLKIFNNLKISINF